jgi:two-component system chemotaxis sensor kinase CheA
VLLMSDQSIAHTKANQDFIAEAEDIIERLGAELADLSDMAETGELNPDVLNSIFRGAHSLKGLAGMFSFSNIADLSHNMENLLDSLRLGKVKLTSRTVAVLCDAHELLSTMLRTFAIGDESGMSLEIATCVAKINACLAVSGNDEAVPSFDELDIFAHVLDSMTEYEEHRLRENLAKKCTIYNVHASFDLTTFDTELSTVTTILKEYGEVISTLPSVGVNNENNIDFEILFGSRHSLEKLVTAVEHTGVTVTRFGSAPAHDLPGTDTAVPPSGAPRVTVPVEPATVPSLVVKPAETKILSPPQMSEDPAASSAKSMSRTVRVDIGKLDELMNIVGELVLANSTIEAISTRMRDEGYSGLSVDLGKAAKGLERKLSELQKGVMYIRMIPIGQLYEKMSLIVRKISREQNKKVALKFFGADTELDKLIIEDVSDPMMHIIRNAIDHGIESKEVRLAAGKDEKGTIRISSYPKGSHVVIEIEDDGGGIDVEKIKRKAVQLGWVTDAGTLTDREALEYIFLPGFSTNDTVSEISGRGFGMDVVKNNIAAVSGMVDIETRKGEGSRFIITLPVTLAIIKALIIRCGGRIYALPIMSVLESLVMTSSEVATVERKEVITLRDATLPLLRLENYFEISSDVAKQKEFYVVVVGVAEKRLGIVVDELIGQQDIVIKSLGDSFKRFRGIAGAADLGDQRTILVLDATGIINETLRTGN